MPPTVFHSIPVRGQRGVRRGRDGPDPRAGNPARKAQCQRRRLRIGPPDRRVRRAPGGDPGQCPAQPRPEARCGVLVHRRRRGHRDRSGGGLIAFTTLLRS